MQKAWGKWKDLLFTNQLNTWNLRNMFPFPLKAFSPINHIWNSFSTRSKSFRPVPRVHPFIELWAIIKLVESIFTRIHIIISRTDNGNHLRFINWFSTGNCANWYWLRGWKYSILSNDEITFKIECNRNIYTHLISHNAHCTHCRITLSRDFPDITVIIIKCYDCKKFYVWQFLFGKWRITIYRSDTVCVCAVCMETVLRLAPWIFLYTIIFIGIVNRHDDVLEYYLSTISFCLCSMLTVFSVHSAQSINSKQW